MSAKTWGAAQENNKSSITAEVKENNVMQYSQDEFDSMTVVSIINSMVILQKNITSNISLT